MNSKGIDSVGIVELEKEVRQLPGGTRPVQALDKDGKYYVVKSPNNPQTTRSLCAEWMGTKLMKRIGLPVPEIAVAKYKHSSVYRLASRYPVNPAKEIIYDLETDLMLSRVGNADSLVGAYLSDILVANADQRQFVICRHSRILNGSVANAKEVIDIKKPFCFVFIDQSMCFNSPHFNLKICSSDKLLPLLLRCCHLDVRAELQSWKRTIESLDFHEILEIYQSVPADWLDDELDIPAIANHTMRRMLKVHEAVDRLIELWEQENSPYGLGAADSILNQERFQNSKLHSTLALAYH